MMYTEHSPSYACGTIERGDPGFVLRADGSYTAVTMVDGAFVTAGVGWTEFAEALGVRIPLKRGTIIAMWREGFWLACAADAKPREFEYTLARQEGKFTPPTGLAVEPYGQPSVS